MTATRMVLYIFNMCQIGSWQIYYISDCRIIQIDQPWLIPKQGIISVSEWDHSFVTFLLPLFVGDPFISLSAGSTPGYWDLCLNLNLPLVANGANFDLSAQQIPRGGVQASRMSAISLCRRFTTHYPPANWKASISSANWAHNPGFL